jgi:hypothetical protein
MGRKCFFAEAVDLPKVLDLGLLIAQGIADRNCPDSVTSKLLANRLRTRI